jgi:hypothetical protein
VVEAGGGVEDEVAGGEFNALNAIGVFDAEFAAVVFVRGGEEESGGEVGANAMACAGDVANGVVNVGPEILAARVAVEEGREYAEGKGGGEEEGIAAEGGEDDLAEFAGDGAVFGELGIVFGFGGLMAGGDFAIDPVGFVEELAGVSDLLGVQDIWNSD